MLLSELAADINATIADHGDLPVISHDDSDYYPVREIVVRNGRAYVCIDLNDEPISSAAEGG